jgi:hypothetical protein
MPVTTDNQESIVYSYVYILFTSQSPSHRQDLPACVDTAGDNEQTDWKGAHIAYHDSTFLCSV